MHVHDLNPKKTLITMIAFVALIVVGFLTMHKPLLSYTLDLEDTLETVNDKSADFTPDELDAYLKEPTPTIVLIDIRDRFSYGQGHIPGAKNISAYDLSQEQNIALLNEYKDKGITVVLYGNNQLQANGPWMLFRQVGYDNVKVLLGGYTYYKEQLYNDNAKKNSYEKEVALYDFAKVAQDVDSDTENTSTVVSKPAVLLRKKKPRKASGGC